MTPTTHLTEQARRALDRRVQKMRAELHAQRSANRVLDDLVVVLARRAHPPLPPKKG